MRLCHFRAQNGPFVLNKIFWYKYHYYFHLPIGPFHWAKFKKILTADPELWRCTIYGPKMVHLPLTNFFLENYSYHSHLLMSKILKFFQRIDAQFLSPKWLISPNENFFRKPLNEPCFFHSWLSMCQKLKSDINVSEILTTKESQWPRDIFG